MCEISFFCRQHGAKRYLGVKKEGNEYRLRCCKKPEGGVVAAGDDAVDAAAATADAAATSASARSSVSSRASDASSSSSSSSVSAEDVFFEAINLPLIDENCSRNKFVFRSNLRHDLYLGLMEGSTNTTMVIGIVQGTKNNIVSDAYNRFSIVTNYG